MARAVVLRRELPGDATLAAPRPWRDEDASGLQAYLQRVHEMTRVGRDAVQQGVSRIAHDYSFHPTKDYLNSLVWDGVPRIGTWLSDYLASENTEYTRTVGRMWLIGMTARIMSPGCKMDYLLVLEGAQGTFKSQTCRELCGPWVSDHLPNLRHDERAASQHLRGIWLIEVSELAAFNHVELDLVNAFVTAPEQRYLPRYATNETIEKRQCGFIGTTNQTRYLRDPTGARRFWPVSTGQIRIRALRRDRDQLWAEALVAYRSGELWNPTPEFERRVILIEQLARYDADAWTDAVSEALAELVAEATAEAQRNRTQPEKAHASMIEIWQRALSRPLTIKGVAINPVAPPVERFSRSEQLRMHKILQFLGWRCGKRLHGYTQWCEP